MVSGRAIQLFLSLGLWGQLSGRKRFSFFFVLCVTLMVVSGHSLAAGDREKVLKSEDDLLTWQVIKQLPGQDRVLTPLGLSMVINYLSAEFDNFNTVLFNPVPGQVVGEEQDASAGTASVNHQNTPFTGQIDQWRLSVTPGSEAYEFLAANTATLRLQYLERIFEVAKAHYERQLLSSHGLYSVTGEQAFDILQRHHLSGQSRLEEFIITLVRLEYQQGHSHGNQQSNGGVVVSPAQNGISGMTYAAAVRTSIAPRTETSAAGTQIEPIAEVQTEDTTPESSVTLPAGETEIVQTDTAPTDVARTDNVATEVTATDVSQAEVTQTGTAQADVLVTTEVTQVEATQAEEVVAAEQVLNALQETPSDSDESDGESEDNDVTPNASRRGGRADISAGTDAVIEEEIHVATAEQSTPTDLFEEPESEDLDGGQGVREAENTPGTVDSNHEQSHFRAGREGRRRIRSRSTSSNRRLITPAQDDSEAISDTVAPEAAHNAYAALLLLREGTKDDGPEGVDGVEAGWFSALGLQLAGAARQAGNRVVSGVSRWWRYTKESAGWCLQSVGRGLAEGGRTAREAAKSLFQRILSASSYFKKAAPIERVYSRHNRIKTSRTLLRNRKVVSEKIARSAPILTLSRAVVFVVTIGLLEVGRYLYGSRTDEEAKNDARSKTLEEAKNNRNNLFVSVGENFENEAGYAAGLLEAFGNSRWQKHHFPVTGVFNLQAFDSHITEPVAGLKGCEYLAYGIIGYPPGYLSVAHNYRYSEPSFPIKNNSFVAYVQSAVRHLHEAIKQAKPADTELAVAAVASGLKWCGLPSGKAATELHSECLKIVAEEIRTNGVDWYRGGRHVHAFHNLVLGRGAVDREHLATAPLFPLNPKCALENMTYQPRMLRQTVWPFPFLNQPLGQPGEDSFDWSTEHLPERFRLVTHDAFGYVVKEEDLQKSPSGISLTRNMLHEVQTENEQSSSHILIFNGNKVIASRPRDDEISVLRPPPDSPQPVYWFYQQKRHKRQGLRRENTGFLSYMDANLRIMARDKRVLVYMVPAFTLSFTFFGFRLGGALNIGLSLPFMIGNMIVALSRPVPLYFDESQEAALRHDGLKPLLDYYLSSNGRIYKHHILARLMSNSRLPLGVVSYDSVKFEATIPVRLARSYTPLSRLDGLTAKRKAFDKAVTRCSQYFGVQSCHSENPNHLEFIRFYLATCTESELSFCQNLWNKASTKHFFRMISNKFDWQEGYTAFGDVETEFIGRELAFVLTATEQKKAEKMIILSSAFTEWDEWYYHLFGNTHPDIVSIDGAFQCSDDEKSLSCVYNRQRDQTWIYSADNSEDFEIKVLKDGESDFFMLEFYKKGLLPPMSNKQTTQRSDSHVYRKACSEIAYDNLKSTCEIVLNQPERVMLAHLLEQAVGDNLWIPVYKPAISRQHDGVNAIEFQFTRRVHFRELSDERILKHISILGDDYDYLRQLKAGGGNHVDLETLANSLIRTGVVESVDPGLELLLYKKRYASFFSADKRQRRWDDCFFAKMRQKHLCHGHQCILMTPGWRIDYQNLSWISHHTSRPTPAWIRGDSAANADSFGAMQSLVVPETINTEDPVFLYVYQYDYEAQQMILLEPDESGIVQLSEIDTPYVVTKKPLGEATSHYQLSIFKNGRRYNDECRFPFGDVESTDNQYKG